MPDLSSVTQDLFKLISQSKKLPTAVVQPHYIPSILHTATGKNRAQSLPSRAVSGYGVSLLSGLCQAMVSESLPSRAVSGHGDKKYSKLRETDSSVQSQPGHSEDQQCHRNVFWDSVASGDNAGPAGFLMEELKRITGVGTKAPMFFLCLTELKRLEHVQGVGTSAMYKILSQAHT
ncbi:uncharacterized protein ACWYII_005056 isoform 1-T4 [Salvelinus alpinus]|uniref:uncharacterized protein n=1 Tax=Salvelinus alpinus TaxID=8036 RepID=UPI0039FC96B5